MTTYATRSPLQALHNPHMMSGLRRSSRRTSANLSNQEDAPATNGVGKETERSQRSDAGVNLKSVNGSSRIAGGRGKRKLGERISRMVLVDHLQCSL